MRVLIMHTAPPEQCEDGRWQWEFDLEPTVEAILEAIPDGVVRRVHGDAAEMIDMLARERPDVVFNLCEAPLCNPRLEPHAAALFEWLRVPFTGASSETLAICRRKDLTKRLLTAAGVPVPRSDVFPCIVKPLDEDGSAGIREDSICESPADVAGALARLRAPAIVEEFLRGREFVVSMWGAATPEAIVIAEVAFTAGVRLLTYEGKWDMESHAYVNAPLRFPHDVEPQLRHRLMESATATWRAVGLRGYATVDLRLDDDGVPRVIDVNPNAALNAEGRVYRAAANAGWTWQQFVMRQIEWARAFAN
jgi:D-alanine-D-alanine ligase